MGIQSCNNRDNSMHLDSVILSAICVFILEAHIIEHTTYIIAYPVHDFWLWCLWVLFSCANFLKIDIRKDFQTFDLFRVQNNSAVFKSLLHIWSNYWKQRHEAILAPLRIARTGEWCMRCQGVCFSWGSWAAQSPFGIVSACQTWGQRRCIGAFLFQALSFSLLLCSVEGPVGLLCLETFFAGKYWFVHLEGNRCWRRGNIICLPCLWCLILTSSHPALLYQYLLCRVSQICHHPRSMKNGAPSEENVLVNVWLFKANGD